MTYCIVVLQVGVAFSLGLCGCSTEQTFLEPDYGLERMIEQPYVEAFEVVSKAPGFGMLTDPDGTVPRGSVVGPPELVRGVGPAGYATRVMVEVSMPLLAHGRERFEIFCAPCHGVLGDGDSVVSANMPLVRARSLHTPEVRAYPPGRIYRVINEGYGLMPAYAVQLSLTERWAVVAYVQALQLSQNIDVASLDTAARTELERATRGDKQGEGSRP